MTAIPGLPRPARTLCRVFAVFAAAFTAAAAPLQIAGIYPHLAVSNEYGECGIGAVVPWAGRLWLYTYPPHYRTGSSDKLYEIDGALRLSVRPESVGGTHASRMIHRESGQLILGPYFIDARGGVRALDPAKQLPARITAVARHLREPADKVYFYDMEGPIWETDVRTLETRRLFIKPAPGWHGKGAYTGQGRLVIANNGESQPGNFEGSNLPWELPQSAWSSGPEDAGVLAEWDGSAWTIISRRQHTDVTRPGGLEGESSPGAPLWSLGWDRRSVLLHVRHDGAWHRFRVPKASYTYDPAHGWFTEWPRIRKIGGGRFLMNMHGAYFDFPPAFAPGRAGGLRPLCSHLHQAVDFCEWNGRLVIARDDASIMGNPLAGISQSNLRFIAPAELKTAFGPPQGWGGVWDNDPVQPGETSDPFLIAGFPRRVLHLAHDAGNAAAFTVELDRKGDGRWRPWKTVRLPASGYLPLILPENLSAEWLRVKSLREGRATAFLHLSVPRPARSPAPALFAALAPAASGAGGGGFIRPDGLSRNLHFLAGPGGAEERAYEVDEQLRFRRMDAPETIRALRQTAAIQADYTSDAASVIVTDAQGRRRRLPKSGDAHDPASERGLREVVTERFLAQFDGTFYEIPRAGRNPVPDFARMKPVASHHARITDFCTWRGLLVLAGTRRDALPGGRFFRADDSGAGLWFGAVDDLFQLGAPAGQGGPWKETAAQAGLPGDPYLMAGYDRKTLSLSHERNEPVSFTVEVDVAANDRWHVYRTLAVPPGKTIRHTFPHGFSAHWVRITADKDAVATAWFEYR